MKRQAIRGFVLLALLVAVADSTGRAQNTPDKVTVRDRKDGSTKTYDGAFTVGATGFQVVGAEKKVIATVAPDDVVKVVIGDLPGVDRSAILALNAKEEKRDWDGARLGYAEQAKKSGLGEKAKVYLEFKRLLMANKIADESDEKGWKEKADGCITDWMQFLASEDTKFGWEQWPAVRACTRLQIERGKYDDAARAWGRVAKNPNLPPDARVEAGIQEVDLQIRAKAYSAAANGAAELLKTAAGTKKDRLVIYDLAAKAGGDAKWAEGIDKIKAEMNKSKDPVVHATGFAMMGELYLADSKTPKPRDAMWMFLWVETVVNQDKDESFKALVRLNELFENQLADEDQAKKYRDKIKRFRGTF
jgi:hypothetical protein